MRIADTIENNRWLKVEDLGTSPPTDYLDLTIKKAEMGTFGDGKVSLDLTFHEHEKCFGCQPTNRKRLMMLFGENVQVESLPGQRLRLVCEMTTKRNGDPCWGVRIVPIPNTMQAESAVARERIDSSIASQGLQPHSAAPVTLQGDPVMDQSPQEPDGFGMDWDQSRSGM